MKVFLCFAFLLVISDAFGMHSSFSTRVTRSEQEKKLCEHIVKKYGKKFEDTPTKFVYYDLHLALKTQYVVQYCKYIKFEWGMSWRRKKLNIEIVRNALINILLGLINSKEQKHLLMSSVSGFFLFRTISWILDNPVILGCIWKLIIYIYKNVHSYKLSYIKYTGCPAISGAIFFCLPFSENRSDLSIFGHFPTGQDMNFPKYYIILCFWWF